MRGDQIGASAGIQEDAGVARSAPRRRLQGVAGAIGEFGRVEVVAFGGARPALLGEDHGDRLAGEQVRFGERLRFFDDGDLRSARVAVLLRIGFDLLLHKRFRAGFGSQHLFDLRGLRLQLFTFGVQLLFFEPRQLAQPQIENRARLFVREIVGGHQHGLGLVFVAHDADDVVEMQVGGEQPLDEVQPAADSFQPVFEAAAHGGDAEAQPFGQKLGQAMHPRAAIQADDVEVQAVAALQVGGGEEVAHQALDVDPVRARREHQPGRVLVIRFVADVHQHRQLARLHLRGDLFQHLRRRHLVRQPGDDDVRHSAAVAVLAHVVGTGAQRAAPAGVALEDFLRRRDDGAVGGEVRARHVRHQLGGACRGVVEQVDAGVRHFAQVVRGDVRGHAHGDAGAAVQQHHRQTRRQQLRLFEHAVEVRHEIHRALGGFGKQQFGVGRKARFGVAHGGEGLGIVRRAPVAVPLHQGIAAGERLRHEHHRLVAGALPVRMVFAEHVADGARRLHELGRGGEVQFGHRVDDAPLHRLQAVAHMGQGALADDVHGVVQIGALGVLVQRHALHAVVRQGGHAGDARGAVVAVVIDAVGLVRIHV